MRAACVALATLTLVACAATAPVVPGAEPGKFVRLACADNKAFQLRVSESGRSVRVRALHGSAELEARADGDFVGDGYQLRTRGEGAIRLDHLGKPEASSCKVAS